MEFESYSLIDRNGFSLYPHRKYYEEIVEEKRQKQRATANAAYCDAKKSLKKLCKELDGRVQNQKKEITIPLWYQELSVYQENTLNCLQSRIREDLMYDDTNRVRLTLKELGIKTKIPHQVAKNAILHSKLYSIDFLQKILEYVSRTFNETTKQKGPLVYTFEERLLISGIVYLGLPSLFMKLDYCLGSPVIEKKADYLPLKNIPPKKYLSPYLEKFKLYDTCWRENQKIKSYNSKIKVQRRRQKLRENMINERKQQQENLIRNVELKMKRSKPVHPLEALFVKLPLDSSFEDGKNESEVVVKEEIEEEEEEDERSKTKPINPEVPSDVCKDIANGSASKIEDVDAINGRRRVTIADDIKDKPAMDVANVQNPTRLTASSDDFSTFVSSVSSSRMNSYDSGGPDEPQRYHLKYQEPFEYEYDEVDEDSEPEETVRDEDFSFLVDGHERFWDGENVDAGNDGWKQKPFGWLPEIVTNGTPIEKQKTNARRSPQILEESFMANAMCDQSKIEVSMIKMFNHRVNAFPDYRLHLLGVNESSSSDKKNRNENPIKSHDANENVIMRSEKSRSDVPVERDMDLKSGDIRLFCNVSNRSESERKETEEKSLMDNTQLSDEKKDKVHIFDKILTEIQKLPKRKKLMEALLFLAKLGDPIANLPDVVDLEVLKQWYEFRFNVNGHLTRKQIAEMLAISKKLWSMPRPKLISVPIPLAPRYGGQCAKWTWDRKNRLLKTVEGLKDGYVKRVTEHELETSRRLYPTLQTARHDGKLNAEFKRTYHCYFPARADDFVLVDTRRAKRQDVTR